MAVYLLDFFFLSLDGSDTSLGVTENSVALRVASASAKANSEPDGPCSSSEKQDGGDDTETKAQTGLDQCIGDDNVPLISKS